MEELNESMASGEKFTASSDAILQFFNDGHVVCFFLYPQHIWWDLLRTSWQVLHCWCMKCVDYDEDFQREIAGTS